MGLQIVQKILQYIKNRGTYSLWIFNVNNLGTGSHEKQTHVILQKDCLKMFCESLREHEKNLIDFEKKKLLILAKEELKSHQDAKVCYICGKN